jgi:hypothetical protein
MLQLSAIPIRTQGRHTTAGSLFFFAYAQTLPHWPLFYSSVYSSTYSVLTLIFYYILCFHLSYHLILISY